MSPQARRKDMKYSRSVKAGILKKVLPPENRSIRSMSRETRISEQTIRNWIKASKSGSFEDGIGKSAPGF